MANIAIDHSVRYAAWPRFRIAKRWHVLVCHWQRRRHYRRALRQLLAETSDPRILADVGFVPPPRSTLDRWTLAMFYSHCGR